MRRLSWSSSCLFKLKKHLNGLELIWLNTRLKIRKYLLLSHQPLKITKFLYEMYLLKTQQNEKLVF